MDRRLAQIREGLVRGIREEIERRRRLGIPLYVADDEGNVHLIMADGQPAPEGAIGKDPTTDGHVP